MAEKQNKPNHQENQHHYPSHSHSHRNHNSSQSSYNRPTSSSFRPKPKPRQHRSSSSASEKACIVCYRDVIYYSVGACEHSVCFECSSRMRILMEQNECPTCRQLLESVIFTDGMKAYSDLKDKIRMYTLIPKYGIYLEDETIKAAFDSLLEHRCLRCIHQPTFPDFQGLNQHMQRQHELFACNLCVEHIKHFSKERKFYTRSDLGFHKRKGDRDDTSHRGHPICKFCDKRFFDNDDLYKHLRQDHYFCHFCDADGYNHYYNTYDDLRLHYRKEHFLCEEEHCAEEKFTSVFRSEIDLKAHLASAHSRLLGKQGTKQARTLDFDFAMAPRPENERGRFGRPRGDRDRRGGDRGRDRDPEGGFATDEENFFRDNQIQQVPSIQPKIDSAKDFPTLDGGEAGGGVSVTLNGASIAQKVALRSGVKGPVWNAKTKYEDDFPALDGSIPNSVAEPPNSKFLLSKITGRMPQPQQTEHRKTPSRLEDDFPTLPTSASVPSSNKVKSGSGKVKMKGASKYFDYVRK